MASNLSTQLNTLALSEKDPKSMTAQEKYDIARSVGEECIQEEELLALFNSTKEKIIAYDGFEPSGRMHIAQVC
jgi:tyrosyl-tRNA synthetase